MSTTVYWVGSGAERSGWINNTICEGDGDTMPPRIGCPGTPAGGGLLGEVLVKVELPLPSVLATVVPEVSLTTVSTEYVTASRPVSSRGMSETLLVNTRMFPLVSLRIAVTVAALAGKAIDKVVLRVPGEGT
jgi:hypothetical protein